MDEHFEIESLIDFPAVKKLASALHRLDANRHGAAIMIGAGFSRSAAEHVSGEGKMPLWFEFSEKLAKQLSPVGDARFSDPLRVAEEYRAYFGQAALNDQIRFQINDEAWLPGKLYETLLELPWSEIMTTNWDTLLERAAENVHSPYYTPVTKTSDLAWAESPRIVKVHGTIGMNDHFISAQEDYRTYPEKYAPFVNFARQVFIENELCLLGFSGDDPNFLHWAGWVRDHLAGHARKIYLVGALNLTAARRKHLESINISPIDLWDSVKRIDDRDKLHQTAIELFLKALHDEAKSITEPQNWRFSDLLNIPNSDHSKYHVDPEYAAECHKVRLPLLKRDRETYPGWVVTPPSVISRMWTPAFDIKILSGLEDNLKAELLFELSWRYSISYDEIPNWLQIELFQVANPELSSYLPKKQQMKILLLLLKNSRWFLALDEESEKKSTEFIKNLETLLNKYSSYLPDCDAEISFHKALVARDNLRFDEVVKLLPRISGDDPIWKLRNASLAMDIGRFEYGLDLIAKAYGELLKKHRKDHLSIPILSRLTWANWLLNQSSVYSTVKEDLPDFAESKYRKWLCDPWLWFDDLQYKTRKWLEDHFQNQVAVIPMFDQGVYRNNNNTRNGSYDNSELFKLDGINREAGVPIRGGQRGTGIGFLSEPLEKLILSNGVNEELWKLRLTVRISSSASARVLTEVFSRIGVACISQQTVDSLTETLVGLLEFYITALKSVEASSIEIATRINIVLEILSRLVVRTSNLKAKELFDLGITIAVDNELDYSTYEYIDNLISNSINSIPPNEQGELLIQAISFPLANESKRNWPNPVIEYINKRSTYPGIDKAIDTLINAINSDGTKSSIAAIQRLMPLLDTPNFLTETEKNKIGQRLWSGSPNFEKLPETRLHYFAYLLWPSPDHKKVKALVKKYLFEDCFQALANTHQKLNRIPSPELIKAVYIFDGMANAAENRDTKLKPNLQQAKKIFYMLTSWRPWMDEPNQFYDFGYHRVGLTRSVGNALSYSILPALPLKEKDEKRFEKIMELYKDVTENYTILPALIHFEHLSRAIGNKIEKTIRKALQSQSALEVGHATIAIRKWGDLAHPLRQGNIQNLVNRLVVLIESERFIAMPQLLWTARYLYKNNRLSADQENIIIEAIPNIYNSCNYSNVGPMSQEAITASSVRAECIRFAKVLLDKNPELKDLESLIEASKSDALPEVRFALFEK